MKKTRLVALEWDETEVRIVLATQKGRQLRIRAAERVELPEAAEEVLPETIRAVLQKHRINKGECLLAVGRSAVELKHLTLPPVPDAELPELVRFQALREFAAIGDDWAIDYLPLDKDETEPRHVLAAALNPQYVASLQATCEQVGLEVGSIVVRPCGMASLVARQFQLADDEVSLLVDPLEKQLDLAVLQGQSIVILRCARADCTSLEEAALNGAVLEVRRTVVAAANRLQGRRLSAIYLCGKGPAQQALAQSLQAEFDLPVHLFDPFDKLSIVSEAAIGPDEDRSRYAPLVGMLLDAVDAERQPIDFLNPRQKPPAPDYRRPIAIAAASVLALVMLGGGWIWQQLSFMDQEIEMLSQESRSLDDLVKKAQELEKKTGEIDKWAATDIDWLGELHRLSLALPPAQETLITQLRASTREGGGEIQLEGLVKDAGTITQLETKLRDPQHMIEHKAGQQSSRDERYRWTFKSAVVISTEPEVPAKPQTAQPPLTQAAAGGR